ncbi:DUF3797 domain-containing protein [Paenibacillus sp. FSL E2-0274]|uniref:DUF3797 domain-containing protein n=1 Tax=Paenibacillus TaxID=44249 RepID=UPI00096DB5B4|nr:DUF3797 domain-containing protein [Paenibacillus odorifer]OME29363.1 DUF3797 domain-containing protein [Paenibacillus odorifer]
MKIMRALELAKEYNTCPECGNQYVGNGEGTVSIESNTFRRTCKCGWKVEIEVEEGDNQ